MSALQIACTRRPNSASRKSMKERGQLRCVYTYRYWISNYDVQSLVKTITIGNDLCIALMMWYWNEHKRIPHHMRKHRARNASRWFLSFEYYSQRRRSQNRLYSHLLCGKKVSLSMSLEPISATEYWIGYRELRKCLRCRKCTLVNQISPVNIPSSRLQEQIKLMSKKINKNSRHTLLKIVV
jgi:hypothetical protein